MTKQELFTKVTGLTFDVEKITDPVKLAWLIPDGAMLDNAEGRRFETTKEFMSTAGIDVDGKVSLIIESTAGNGNPKAKPSGKGWKKIIDVAGVEGSAAYWTLNGVTYDEDPTFEESDSYDYIYDEASWNASFTNGMLKKYYTAYPDEDRYNTQAGRWAWAADKVDGEWPDYCVQCWVGAVSANGAKYPWICPNFDTDVNSTIIFRYEGKGDVTPWNDTIFGNAEGHKEWGCASVANEFGDDTLAITANGGSDTFDINKFTMILEHQGVEYVPAVEAVEEQYHWEREVVKED